MNDFTKKVIINADDFGISEGVNEGICKTFREGVVTSASLMVNMPATEHAISLIKKHPRLDIGIHLNLSDGHPVLKGELDLLVQQDGTFIDFFVLVLRTLTRKSILKEIENELRAQIRKLLSYGIVPSHINFHKYIQIFPEVLNIILKLAKDYNIYRVRNSAEIRISNIRQFLHLNTLRKIQWRQALTSLAVSIFAKFHEKRLRKANVIYPQNFLGIYLMNFSNVHNGGQNYIKDCLKLVAPGSTEIMCHPGFIDRGLENRTPYIEQREQELRELVSPETSKLVRELNIELVNFLDL